MSVLVFLLALALGSQAENVCVEAKSLMKKDVANGFPLLVFEAGFAVLEVHIKNDSTEAFSIDLEELQVFSKKGKEIERALPTDIAPKLMKFYTGGSVGIHGEAYSGYPRRPTQAEMDRSPTIGTASTVGKVSATKGQEIRALLESFELNSGTVAPGEEAGGYVYLKSKKSGNKLNGGYLQLDAVRGDF